MREVLVPRHLVTAEAELPARLARVDYGVMVVTHDEAAGPGLMLPLGDDAWLSRRRSEDRGAPRKFWDNRAVGSLRDERWHGFTVLCGDDRYRRKTKQDAADLQ